jgi:transposase
VLLLDNASIHRSAQAFSLQEELGLNIMFLAPYSFPMAAVEKLFSFIKNRDLNPLAVRAYSR